MERFLSEFIAILTDASAYLLIGFAVSGILSILMSRHERIRAPMLGTGPRPVLMATLLGLPLPLCSCSVLPTGMMLLRQGVRRGPVASFLITVPETDVVSIMMTYGLLGPVMAVIRPLASLLTGIVTGLAVSMADSGSVAAPPAEDVEPDVERTLPLASDESCCCAHEPPEPKSWLRRALHAGFVDLFDHLIVRILVGLAIGAALTALLPMLDPASLTAHRWTTYLVMLLLGIPMYVCATSSTPTAAGMIAAGLSPGAALVFLLSGPATNTANIAILARQFGRRLLAIHLASIAAVSLLSGFLLDALVPSLPPIVRLGASAAEGGPAPWAVAGTLVLLALSIMSLRRTHAVAQASDWWERRTGRRPRRASVIGAGVAVALALWLAQGLFVVAPGERAAVTTFGRVSAAPLGPGLHHHWPAPFGKARTVSVAEVRRAIIGHPADVTARASTATWMLSGDENIIDISASIFYRVRDDRASVLNTLFRVSDLDALVRATGEWALRRFVAGNAIDALLTTERGRMETSVEDDYLQPALDLCGAGVEIVKVSLTSVHAPLPVHAAFRDVASAAEDAVQKINQAREYSERTVLEAHGTRNMQVAEASGTAIERTAAAVGDSTAFALAREAYRLAPDLMRSRLYLETIDATLPHLRKYVDLTPPGTPRPDVWLKGSDAEALPSFLQDMNSPQDWEEH